MFSHSKTHILNVTFSVSVHKKKHPVGQKTKKTSFSTICVFFYSEVISPNTNISRHDFLCIFADFGQKTQISSFPLRKKAISKCLKSRKRLNTLLLTSHKLLHMVRCYVYSSPSRSWGPCRRLTGRSPCLGRSRTCFSAKFWAFWNAQDWLHSQFWPFWNAQDCVFI